MPWGAVAGVVGSVAGSAISGAMSPSTSGGGGSYYVPTGLPAADSGWIGLLGQLGNTYYCTNPDILNTLQTAFGNSLNANGQYAPGYQNAANAAGTAYGNLANSMGTQATGNYGMQNALQQAGANVFNMALDPQNALYDRTRQQLQDQTGVTNSMYGLGSSAAGAGVANQALSNFNIDWQNNQLGRAVQGLGAYAGAGNTALNYGQLANQQASAAPGYMLSAGSTPYTTATTLAGAPISMTNAYTGALNSGVYGPIEGIQGQIIPYMNQGIGAQAVPFQSQAQGAGALGSMVSQGISGLGSNSQVQNAFSNFFSPASGSFSGGDFSGAFTSSPYYSGGGNSYGFTMG
ncbi:hypothetical protein L0Z31_17505 (plasmid) [Burkholderia vietnamiensis]|uniref:hypothetical protein n=1 Tax=Burkholderia vietnamiensis TaxID=60552 RepID=UPI002018FA1A|nr:hypothetical protein [Burkholderia vietnamiensis]MCO1349262.1 hypothetical protein [Burkholderia vietnamiensis]MCO1431734.1 hypothetical protein [Burkholderia vietnamiensis]UQN48077.1 hypothetical protein L0Y95_07420 [Burkholderia vietnamiensis]